MVDDPDDEALAFAQRMFELARDGDTVELASYVDAGVPSNLTNAKGDSLLILAAYHGHLATVEALLERGADTARVNDRGQTAAAAAAFKGSLPIVSALLDAGADPTLGAPSAIEVATFFEQTEVAELLAAGRRSLAGECPAGDG